MKVFLPILVMALGVSGADLTPAERKLNAESFDYAWKTIRDKMWEPMPDGLDWQKVHDELLPKVEAAPTMDDARAIMRDMISRLKMTHFGIVAADVYDNVGGSAKGDGEPGMDVRALDGEAIVTRVEDGSSARKLGVKPGWRIVSIGGNPVAPGLKRISEEWGKSTLRDLLLARAVLRQLAGDIGQSKAVEFEDGSKKTHKLEIVLEAPRGNEAKFGFLPAQHVYFESRRMDKTAYIHFNMWLDPVHIAAQFADAVQSCMKCDGIVIDLRGNPGGLGAMSMGMAGWFISDEQKQLGVMKTKNNELKFVVNPRPETFKGRVAILTDGLTGSTSEIFAGGMKDLGRARIIGTRSAGAALPSMFERLPNGDGFQYAVANYISEGGKPLEGIGVIPDDEVRLTRKALLDGHDPVLDAALSWIRSGKDRR